MASTEVWTCRVRSTTPRTERNTGEDHTGDSGISGFSSTHQRNASRYDFDWFALRDMHGFSSL